MRSWLGWSLVLLLAVAPRLAAAPCDGKKGSAATHGDHDEQGKSEADRAVSQVLDAEDGREALVEAILADRQLLTDVANSLTDLPEWRAYIREALAPAETTASGGAEHGESADARQAERPRPRSMRVSGKTQRALRYVMADWTAREQLVVAMMADQPLLRALVRSAAQHPEAREVLDQSLSAARVTPAALPGGRPDVMTESPRQRAPEIYSCPMHPEVRSDRPGKCPKCGMKLRRR